MSAIPVFEIGVWNAWIFMFINFLPMPIIMRVHKGVAEESMKLYGDGWFPFYSTILRLLHDVSCNNQRMVFIDTNQKSTR